VIDYQDFTGRLDAVKTVEIKARVTGYITDAPFKEGDPVEQGSLLFQIDKRPYEADLNQAKANLNVAIADRNFQEKNVERYGKVLNSVSREEYETAVAASEKAAANVAAMQAALARAKLYLEYTGVTAPLKGRISRRNVDPGNLVTADTTALTLIVAENPMYAYFDVDERTYLDLLAQTMPGKSPGKEGLHLPVLMRLANEEEFATVGYVDFVDNRVVATTGTVRMRGVFDNAKGQLKAGLFVRIRLPVSASFKAVLIPDEAIQSDQERKYVWVVNAKNEIEYRPVELGQSIQKLRAIKPPAKDKEGKEGLSEADRVVISGMQRARNGLLVDVEVQAPPTPPDVPLVRVLNANKATN
jgi:multidrug efflux system membrane fusion protein